MKKLILILCLLVMAYNTQAQQNYYDVNAVNGYGLRFWKSDTYKIHMGNTAENKYGRVTDFSIKMNMSNSSNRGWTWGVAGATPIAALSTRGFFKIEQRFESRGYDIIPGTGYGLRFWNSDTYKIHMGNAAENKYGPVTDFSIKMNMSNTASRGWTWGVAGATPIAALSTRGHMQLAGNLAVLGKIETTEMKVLVSPGTGPDYVFEEDYCLRPLSEVDAYIAKNKHLPEIMPASEMEANGIGLGDISLKLLQKIEELTLYTIQQQKQLEASQEMQQKQQALIEAQQQLLLQLQKQVESLQKN